MLCFQPREGEIHESIAEQCVNSLTGLEIFRDGKKQQPPYRDFAPIEDNNGNITRFIINRGKIIWPGATKDDLDRLRKSYAELMIELFKTDTIPISMILANKQYNVVVNCYSEINEIAFINEFEIFTKSDKKTLDKNRKRMWLVYKDRLTDWIQTTKQGNRWFLNNLNSDLYMYDCIFVDLDGIMKPGRTLLPFKPENLKVYDKFVGKCGINNTEGFYGDIWKRFNKPQLSTIQLLKNVKFADMADADRIRARNSTFDQITNYVEEKYDFDAINELMELLSDMTVESKKTTELCYTCNMPLFDDIYILSYGVEILCCPVCTHTKPIPKNVQVYRTRHHQTLHDVLKTDEKIPAKIRDIYKGIADKKVQVDYDVHTATICHTIKGNKQYQEIIDPYQLFEIKESNDTYYFTT